MKPAILFCLFFMSMVFHGCTEKGCTDKTAINFNTIAKKDDGSCRYCITTPEPGSNYSRNVLDYNTSSAHYYEQVVTFTMDETINKYNDKSCGANPCSYTLKLNNNVNQTTEFSFTLVRGSGSNRDTLSKLVSIPPNGSISFDMPPTNANCPGTYFTLVSSITFTYH